MSELLLWEPDIYRISKDTGNIGRCRKKIGFLPFMSYSPLLKEILHMCTHTLTQHIHTKYYLTLPPGIRRFIAPSPFTVRLEMQVTWSGSNCQLMKVLKLKVRPTSCQLTRVHPCHVKRTRWPEDTELMCGQCELDELREVKCDLSRSWRGSHVQSRPCRATGKD